MRLMRLVPIYQTPNTSKKHPQHKVYPYLLRELTIDRPKQVWCVDITYIPHLIVCHANDCRAAMRRGFLYLVAIMDWYSRKVLSWRLSNSIPLMVCKQTTAGQWEADLCVEALKYTTAKYAKPEIMNSPSRDYASHNPARQWIKAVSSLVLNG